ncbi:MAG: N-acetylmuramoyl-L-alanine amidase [bacterium]|nr:MAG: N-acetylmuramoyl-L-alanine amidase [bacterium]
MNARNRMILILVLLSLVPGTASSGPAPRQVTRIRYWTAPDHTRVVLDMSSESSYRVKVLDRPHRIAIDILSGRFSSRVKAVPVGDGVIDRIRVNRLRSTAQVVLDLPRETSYRHFALKPFKGRPHRIVIDVQRVYSNQELERKRAHAKRIADSGDYVVIIDPGHGGSQPGACSRYGLKEKNVVLSLARLTAAEIRKREGFRAVLTRDGDYDVPLARRIEIARSHGGDCFLSLHLNSHRSSRPRGSEIFFLSLEGATDENAQAVAERENLFLEMGGTGEEITDDLKSILFDLNRTNSMYQSSILAGEVAQAMRTDPELPFRGIKQANFVVLRSIAMPSILVEAAFISNKRDIRLLKSGKILTRLARYLATGIVDFLKSYPPVQQAGEVEVVTHVVSSGETLWGIARSYGVTVKQIRTLNRLKKSSRIQPGQKLQIPHTK